ncbi:hypothetical protein EI94DRAFT_1701981 [Lactarius quietus]|nr:hypothetical protein EI94DRAFT_1701981 [Lactarius quietus]
MSLPLTPFPCRVSRLVPPALCPPPPILPVLLHTRSPCAQDGRVKLGVRGYTAPSHSLCGTGGVACKLPGESLREQDGVCRAALLRMADPVEEGEGEWRMRANANGNPPSPFFFAPPPLLTIEEDASGGLHAFHKRCGGVACNLCGRSGWNVARVGCHGVEDRRRRPRREAQKQAAPSSLCAQVRVQAGSAYARHKFCALTRRREGAQKRRERGARQGEGEVRGGHKGGGPKVEEDGIGEVHAHVKRGSQHLHFCILMDVPLVRQLIISSMVNPIRDYWGVWKPLGYWSRVLEGRGKGTEVLTLDVPLPLWRVFLPLWRISDTLLGCKVQFNPPLALFCATANQPHLAHSVMASATATAQHLTLNSLQRLQRTVMRDNSDTDLKFCDGDNHDYGNHEYGLKMSTQRTTTTTVTTVVHGDDRNNPNSDNDRDNHDDHDDHGDVPHDYDGGNGNDGQHLHCSRTE